MKPYLNLGARAPNRLFELRVRAAKHNEKHGQKHTWRDERYYTFLSTQLGHGKNGDTPVWATFDGPFFAREKFADEVEYAPVDHAGWYADPDGDETYRGLVVALPHGKRFMAGYLMSSNDERVYFPDIYDNERDAARAADCLAQRDAEDESCYQELSREAQTLEYKCIDKLERLRECLALRNNPCFKRVRLEISFLLDSIREMRAKLNGEYAQYL